MHEINNQQYYIAQFINTHANMGFPCGSMVKNPPAIWEMQETWVRSLGQKGPLEERIATHSSIVAWRILWTEEPGRLWSTGLQRVGQD